MVFAFMNVFPTLKNFLLLHSLSTYVFNPTEFILWDRHLIIFFQMESWFIE